MITLVVYDIAHDRLRHRVETDCRDAGLRRVQKSVFRGRPHRQAVHALVARLAELIRNQQDSDIQVYALDEDSFGGHVRLTGDGPVEDQEAAPREVVIL